jgi:hypothetical protein
MCTWRFEMPIVTVFPEAARSWIVRFPPGIGDGPRPAAAPRHAAVMAS